MTHSEQPRAPLRVAVTGGTSGLGLALVKTLVARRARVAFVARTAESVERIAKETGGAHIDAQHTDPHTYFLEIAEELRTSYELAYYPTNKAKDDTFRKIRVKVKDGSIKVRAKTGYFSQ